MQTPRLRFSFRSALACLCLLAFVIPGFAPRARAEVLFDCFGENWLETWRVEGGGQVKTDGRALVVIAADLDANPALTTRAEFALAAREQFVVVLQDMSHATRSNHATAGLDIVLGKALTLRVTTWGDGGGILLGGTLRPFLSGPVAAKGGVSLELDYNTRTRRLVVRQFGGVVKTAQQWKVSSPTSPVFVFDEVLAAPLDLAAPVALTVRVRSQHNGGTAPEGTRIGGLLIEAK